MNKIKTANIGGKPAKRRSADERGCRDCRWYRGRKRGCIRGECCRKAERFEKPLRERGTAKAAKAARIARGCYAECDE